MGGTVTRQQRGLAAPYRLFIVLVILASIVAVAGAPGAQAAPPTTTWLTADDFKYGTYLIDEPGVYRLAEDISFNPNSPETLTEAIDTGLIPPEMAAALELPYPVDASHSGSPLFTQLLVDGTEAFTPGGPLDPRYDPSAFGVGFFAAIAISADGVVLDLNGKTISQSAEHALLQRFFAVIELADQPFIPNQGPSGFGDEIDPAMDVVVKNGTIGLSSHHGIHGNGNVDVTIKDVTFEGYEVGAVALNGVEGLLVKNVTATNRKDIPVLGTFSSGQFIKFYVDHLVRTGSPTTLTVQGTELTAADIQATLRHAINNVHHDIIVDPNIVDGRAQIDPVAHPDEYALFNNPSGLIDGNSYSFLVNQFGVAVNGFPTRPDGETTLPSRDVTFRNVHVVDQQADIREVIAIDVGTTVNDGAGVATIDPVGAVFQVKNLHPDTGQPVTVSDLDDNLAWYVGNPVANAQALVAKANLNGEFENSHLDVTRLNISQRIVDWVEAQPGSETLAAIGAEYLCNGDSMFHVNKGTIAFKMDAAVNVRMIDTSVDGLHNFGAGGSTLCGDYSDGFSHPAADLPGYGGAITRAYTFAGSDNVLVKYSSVHDVSSQWGNAVGYDFLTDARNVRLVDTSGDGLTAGWGGPNPEGSPTAPQQAMGYHASADATKARVVRGCATTMSGPDGTYFLDDHSGKVKVVNACS